MFSYVGIIGERFRLTARGGFGKRSACAKRSRRPRGAVHRVIRRSEAARYVLYTCSGLGLGRCLALELCHAVALPLEVATVRLELLGGTLRTRAGVELAALVRARLLDGSQVATLSMPWAERHLHTLHTYNGRL
jgi:hypothetical protein